MVDFDPIEDSEMTYLEDLQRGKATTHALPAEALEATVGSLKLGTAVSVNVNSTAEESIRVMKDRGFGSVLVEDNGRLVGIFTERDVLKKIVLTGIDTANTLISVLMTPAPESVRLNDAIKFAVHLMAVGGYRHIPVTDDQGCPLHVISMRDITEYMADYFPEEIVNLSATTGNFADHRHGG